MNYLRKFSPLAILFVFTLVGCARRDDAVGHWTGQWFYDAKGAAKPGGALECDVTRASKAEWLAIFSAQWGAAPGKDPEKGKFTVQLSGHREEDHISFGGDVDLGKASGGVFNWTGAIKDGLFTGVYKSKFVNGTFEMKRTSPEPVTHEGGDSTAGL